MSDFVSLINQQIERLEDEEYNYDALRIYAVGIARPWVFTYEHEFDLETEGFLIVRDGPSDERENEEVPEYVFPLAHIVATELIVRRGRQ